MAFLGPDFDPTTVVSTIVGSASFRFSDCNTGNMDYVVDGDSGSLNLTRITNIDGLSCTAAGKANTQKVL